MGWQWHQVDHMQIICTSLQTDLLWKDLPNRGNNSFVITNGNLGVHKVLILTNSGLTPDPRKRNIYGLLLNLVLFNESNCSQSLCQMRQGLWKTKLWNLWSRLSHGRCPFCCLNQQCQCTKAVSKVLFRCQHISERHYILRELTCSFDSFPMWSENFSQSTSVHGTLEASRSCVVKAKFQSTSRNASSNTAPCFLVPRVPARRSKAHHWWLWPVRPSSLTVAQSHRCGHRRDVCVAPEESV